MKKIKIISALAVAAMAVLSCVKQEMQKGQMWKPVTLTIGAPETKVSSNGTQGTPGISDFRYKFKWDAGDEITIYSITPDTKDEYTSWGTYVTEDGGATATFAGNMPAEYVGSVLIGIHSKYTDVFSVVWNSTRTDFGYNIPATQDGTGYKYAAYAGANNGGTSDWYDSVNNKVIISGYDSKAQWKLISALSRIHVDASYNVKRITVTASRTDGTTMNLVSSGTNKDIRFASNNFYTCSGGGVNTVTIENGGSVLPEDVYFATRNLSTKKGTGDHASDYYLTTLTFTFTNTSDQTATKIVKMGTGISGEYCTGTKNLSIGSINNFGSVTFNPGDFK